MPRTPARYTQADIQRVLRAVKAENYSGSVEFMPDGRIIVVPLSGKETPSAANSNPAQKIEL